LVGCRRTRSGCSTRPPARWRRGPRTGRPGDRPGPGSGVESRRVGELRRTVRGGRSRCRSGRGSPRCRPSGWGDRRGSPRPAPARPVGSGPAGRLSGRRARADRSRQGRSGSFGKAPDHGEDQPSSGSSNPISRATRSMARARLLRRASGKPASSAVISDLSRPRSRRSGSRRSAGVSRRRTSWSSSRAATCRLGVPSRPVISLDCTPDPSSLVYPNRLSQKPTALRVRSGLHPG
jgi:hypothetical protein